jgi:hypothetical protein
MIGSSAIIIGRYTIGERHALQMQPWLILKSLWGNAIENEVDTVLVLFPPMF